MMIFIQVLLVGITVLWGCYMSWVFGGEMKKYDKDKLIPTIMELKKEFHRVYMIIGFFWLIILCIGVIEMGHFRNEYKDVMVNVDDNFVKIYVLHKEMMEEADSIKREFKYLTKINEDKVDSVDSKVDSLRSDLENHYHKRHMNDKMVYR